MPLSDAQRRAISAIKVAGEMTYFAGRYYAGETYLRTDTATAFIDHGYVVLNGERNAAEPRYPSAARVLHYRLTGKDESEGE